MKTLPARFSLLLAAALGTLRAASPDLASSASAFVRAQAQSGVNWETWNPAALQRAKTENKPVYVFIGSWLSELSRATCQQSFANAETIAYLNQHFICVFVDREEHPDVAACAKLYLQVVKQTGGWPVHLWLTPELQPYEGAGYLPPSEEWGRSGFPMMARQAAEAWANDPRACRGHATEAVSMMAASAPDALPAVTPAALADKLARAADAWRATFDAANAGFGSGPKGAEPELLRFLLRGGKEDRADALATLRALLNGALHDPVDGGFFDRTTDAAWRIPYLQKTLGDQARIALAFLDAAQLTGDAALADGARQALDYALKRLAEPAGTFAAAEDATANGRAGYYLWTEAEIDAAAGPDAAAFKSAYGVMAAGNVSADDDPSGMYRGKNILYRATPARDPALEAKVARALAALRAAAASRPAPARDATANAGVHGLMLAALSRAAVQLNDAAYLAAAARTFAAVQQEFVVSADGDLHRMRGSAAPAGAGDYAALALGCREFAKAAKQADAGALADKLLARATTLYFDAKQGQYLASPAALPPGLFVRAPALDDPLSPEALSLLAGVPADEAAALTKGIAAQITEGDTPNGDLLLALKG